MTRTYFITGTDTEVGKTYVSCQLLTAAAKAGKTAVGYKPVAAGCEWRDGAWQNEDALAFLQASNVAVTLNEVNPVALQPAIAPHIAAQQAGVEISEQLIKDGLARLQARQPDVVIMEGAGGWRLPLGNDRFLSHVVQDLALEVIVVVGMRLGCLNHALLTAEAIQADGLKVKGWIANQLCDAMPCFDENLATLERLMPAPHLATVPYGTAPDYAQLAAKILS
ncbi:dethiobiotin synthase [Alteromonas gilva]|uniref:ATP-dependent dethiobiotin synthetase BioD n=1 Tax=Alteromonas gilva TaxID=2987522 RepID=A0ABT5L5W9_9ALTE|nr:dethiobiotin synthase [Alteromonas gilva]MDC8831771.1 dethiobiotin synthase [Alteromonas gilva]